VVLVARLGTLTVKAPVEVAPEITWLDIDPLERPQYMPILVSAPPPFADTVAPKVALVVAMLVTVGKITVGGITLK